jgi:uncharacterized protein YecE (DUF72 family)
MPTEALLAGWRDGTPDDFLFTLKAPRRITHDAKLVRCEEIASSFCRIAGTLGGRLGALLFQLPPALRKDTGRLRAFLGLLPPGSRAAFEFRHESWHDAEVFDALAGAGVALCVADSEKLHAPVEVTADYGYFRLRDEGYQQADIERWADTIAGLPRAREVFVYFKHEEQGLGPDFARRLAAAIERRAPGLAPRVAAGDAVQTNSPPPGLSAGGGE